MCGVVFAWVFALTSSAPPRRPWGAGLVRIATADYTWAFLAAGVLAVLAALSLVVVRVAGRGAGAPLPVPMS